MRRLKIGVAIGVSLATMFFGLNATAASTHSNADLNKRLAECGSIPNGASLTVVATTRLFIFLPKDLYPHLRLNVSSHEATAGPVSNAGADGYAQGGNVKAGCWSHYFEFDVASGTARPTGGIVDIGSKSAFKTVSNYLIHFKVVVSPPSATKQMSGNGTVIGHVILGPVCPVERIPPDPACAPKPYKTAIDIWSTLTGSSYKRVVTNAAGVFNLSLAPGPYALKALQAADGSPYPRCTEVKILVVARKSQNVTVNCDTGIR